MFLADTAAGPVETPALVYLFHALKVVAAFGVIMTVIPFLIWLERKMAAWIQLRDGPTKVGLPNWGILGPLKGWGAFGLLQPLADMIKLVLKEDFVPRRVSRVLFFIAPALMFVPIAFALAVIPFGWGFTWFDDLGNAFAIRYQIADFGVGILFALASLSVAVHGLSLGGWASNNKWATFGAVRAGAQLISYEAAMFMAVLAMVMAYGTLDMQDMVVDQATAFEGGWSIFGWGAFRQPLAFIIMLVCMFAESNRLPFDFPEAEAELVAGYHTEYGSMKFAMFFLGEYYGMCIQSALVVTLFLGGWSLPGIDPTPTEFLPSLAGPLIFCAKCAVFLWLYIQVRWTLPRFRFDQLMSLGWKKLIPLALANVVITALYLNLSS
ncbi:MAG: NADH-quinone oxidoreductase subunit NuoH [Planctomycetes bacterium]|nr:NADH-quinone oxidoreductase subunit NuoH [Planctomycetota bacterium]